jgi:hypothetical protein
MATQTVDSTPGHRAKASVRGSYFFWTSVILLALVLVGFAPTLYLRALFPQAEPNMPLYLYLHGAVLTGWYAWFLVQTWLVRAGRSSIHRQTGWIGAALALGICIVGPMATFGVIPRIRAQGVDFDTDMSALPFVGVEGVTMLEFASPVIWGNLISVAVFAGIVGIAILLRKRAAHHKRLMLLASISLLPPALARISRWPVFGGEDSLLLPVVALALLFSVTVYDLIERKKPHIATVTATLAILAGAVGSNAIAASEFGQQFVRSLA